MKNWLLTEWSHKKIHLISPQYEKKTTFFSPFLWFSSWICFTEPYKVFFAKVKETSDKERREKHLPRTRFLVSASFTLEVRGNWFSFAEASQTPVASLFRKQHCANIEFWGTVFSFTCGSCSLWIKCLNIYSTKTWNVQVRPCSMWPAMLQRHLSLALWVGEWNFNYSCS